MHSPATGSQLGKHFDSMHKTAQPSKPQDSQPSTPCPASPLRSEQHSHSSYHADNHHCSGKCTCSHSQPCSRDCYDDDHHSQLSSHHHCSDTFVGHHDFQPMSESHQMGSTATNQQHHQCTCCCLTNPHVTK